MESPDKRNLGEMFYEHFKAIDTHVIAMIDKDDNKKISYRELFVASLKIARRLKDLGMKEGDILGIVSNNRLEYFAPILACFYLRIVVHPANPSCVLSELRRVYDNSRPKIIFTSNEYVAKMLELQKESDYVEEIVNFDDDYLDILRGDATLKSIEKSSNCDRKSALILNSSGTTGYPKSVVLTQGNFKFAINTLKYPFISYSPDEVAIAMLPFYHGMGMIQTVSIFIHGIKSVILKKFKPVPFCEIVEEYKVRVLIIVPAIGDFLVKHPIVAKYDFKSVKDIICSGSSIGYDLQTILEKKFNCAVRQMYGMTESGGVSIGCVLGKKCKAGSVGTPVPGVEIEVIDAQTKRTLGPNEQGEICVKGNGTMKEYFGNPEATRDIFDERGFLHTGDIGYFDDEGHFFVVDRLKDLIKYKSFQVSPAELEDILKSHNEIADAGVIGVPDERAGELPMAFVVKMKDSKLSEQDVIDYVAERISAQKHLHGGVKFLDDLPKGATGKLLRKQLREML